MRKWNNILARVIVVLFLLHALMGSLMLLGLSNISFKPLSWLLFAAVIAHGVLGVLATVQAVKSGQNAFFLKEFTFGRMAAQLLLILSIFIHLAISVKSMLIAKGVVKFKERTVDWMMVLSLMMLFFAAAVVIYFIQWQI